MKARRHAKILELINAYTIDTQEELLRRLRENGFEVTQATVSRDIKELRLIKTLSPDGKYKYSVGQENTRDYPTKLYSLLSDSAVQINFAGNMVIVKCLTGMAQAVCVAIDSMHLPNIIGTLAGDDTIFIAVKNEEQAQQMVAELKKMVG
ncbi:arginine repressor [Caproiciproducens galactitolivorans]|uniref:Arginine repressor n=1 Tax=Caproiciproducens galactitolivorans TaxID=642589 RepID=A0A4Z0XY93_9FIRM|nr:arginine repressor [Caproiciproducens galactitolivorans]QEY34086.1 arginine repressor [Caproiciproducens galactitolivorans]TGJ76499.1 arginine repressor [Caproiciproducens galactitolivorans]